jgi:hypothetical protein
MTFQISRVVSDGVSLALSRNGAVLTVLFFIAESLGVLLIAGVGTMYVPVDVGTGIATGGEVAAGSNLPTGTAALASLLAGGFSSVVTTPISIVAIRTFVGGRTNEFPDQYIFDRIGRATVSGIVANFLYAALLFIVTFGMGIVLLVAVFGIGRLDLLPGQTGGIALILFAAVGVLIMVVLLVTVAVHFLFLMHEISVRHRGVVGAFRGSWDTVRGNRVRLAGLAIVLIAVRSGVSSVAAPPVEGGWTAFQLVTTPVAMAVAAVVGVVVTAIFARTYRELRPDVSTEFMTTAGD